MFCLATLYQLDHLIKRLGTVPGVFMAAVMVVLFLASFGRLGRWAVMCVMLFCATFSFNGTALQVHLIPPLEDIRFEAEPLTMIFMAFLVLPSFLVRSNTLRTPLLAAAVVFWILEMTYSARSAASVEVEHGMLAIAIFTTILVVLGFGLPHWLRGLDDVHSAARCLGGVAILFLISTTAQLIVNPNAIIISSRLAAITSNPQHAAFILAILLVPVCLLLSSSRESKWMRVMWGATLGLLIVMLIWTGSRTGVLTGLTGVGLLFRRRIGKLLTVGIVAAIFVFLFLAVFQRGSHILSTADTRTGVWAAQLTYFQDSPIFGKMIAANDRGGGESSYLTIAAHLGLVGLTILAVVMYLITTASFRLRRLRAALQTDDDRMIADWIPASLTAIFVGAIFEATLVGTLTFMLLSVYFYLGILKYLSDANTIERAQQQALADHAEEYQQPYITEQPSRYIDVPVPF